MWIRLVALAIGALLLAGAVYGAAPVAGEALIGLAGFATIAALVVGLGPKLRSRGAYDLNELKRVHEREELRTLDPDDALGEPETVLCPCCMTDYPYRLRACPRCGKSR
ncbi:hypothetical protein EON82_18745 [bacterium]|nr:MAG: hypothetical protein EON82_18745 [bacterium]